MPYFNHNTLPNLIDTRWLSNVLDIPVPGTIVRLAKYPLIVPLEDLIKYDRWEIDDNQLSWIIRFPENELIALTLEEYIPIGRLKNKKDGLFWWEDKFLKVLIEDKKLVFVARDFDKHILDYLSIPGKKINNED